MCTYSTCFDHSGGSLKVMNIQLVKIVHIMIMLKRVSSWLRKNLDIRGNHKIQLDSVKIKTDSAKSLQCFLGMNSPVSVVICKELMSFCSQPLQDVVMYAYYTTQPIILAMKYSNSIYLVEEYANVFLKLYMFKCKEVFGERNHRTSLRGSEPSVIAVAFG